MEKREKIMKEIDLLRDRLTSLIENEQKLLDSEIIFTSKLLDQVLNKYNDLTINGKISND